MRNHARTAARRSVRRLTAVGLASTLLMAGCGTDSGAVGDAPPGGSDRLAIVATTTILADVTRQVAGDAAEVTTLMEVGADPHNFEASARQLAEMQQADLIVANGANLEEHLLGPLAEAERAGVPVFHATDHVDTLTLGGGADQPDEVASAEETHASGDAARDADDDHAHEEGSVDPHFWLDPLRTADVARALGQQIGELSDDPAVTTRAADYVTRLERLDGDISEALATIPADARTLVTNHESFNYFADRYDFTVVGTVIPSATTGAEPSARDLEALAATVEREQVSAVFTENTAPGQLAQTLAAEVGTEVQVVELSSDALGGEGSGAATYVDMLRTNAELIRQALSG